MYAVLGRKPKNRATPRLISNNHLTRRSDLWKRPIGACQSESGLSINGVAQEIRAGRRKECSLQQMGILRSVYSEDLMSKGLPNGQREAIGQVERMMNISIGSGVEVITG